MLRVQISEEIFEKRIEHFGILWNNIHSKPHPPQGIRDWKIGGSTGANLWKGRKVLLHQHDLMPCPGTFAMLACVFLCVVLAEYEYETGRLVKLISRKLQARRSGSVDSIGHSQLQLMYVH